MKSCADCFYATDYEFSTTCAKCYHHSRWRQKKENEVPTITNADHIRSMSDEELAEWLCYSIGCYGGDCPGYELCNATDGKANGIKKWLKQPYKENTNGKEEKEEN